MTISYSKGEMALGDIFSMYLGIFESIRLRKEKNYKESSQKIDFIEQKLNKIQRGFGLASMITYFNKANPEKLIKGLKNVITKLKGENPNLEEQVQYIETTIPIIQKSIPLPRY